MPAQAHPKVPAHLIVAILALTGLWTGCGGSGTASTVTDTHETDTFTTTTSQEGSLLVMTNKTSTDTIRIALDTQWGGSIVEISLNGTNYVNIHDTGRELQPAFYDGNAQYDNCSGCTLNWGWDPVLAGDGYNHGTPTISQAVTSGSIYASAQALEWIPDGKGGGPGVPVLSDVLIEQTVTPVTGHSHAFRVHTKATHLGGDLHYNTQQEFPGVHLNVEYNRFVYYGGTAPWTGGAVSITQFQLIGDPPFSLYVPERWGAHVNAQNQGLSVYFPSLYPSVSGFDSPADGTNYFLPLATMTFAPNFVVESDYYVVAGDYVSARQVIYDLHHNIGTPANVVTPFGYTDLPAPGSVISGAYTVSGWAFGNAQVSKVEILVDGSLNGTATYGQPRPDVQNDYPFAPANGGYSYTLDTTIFTNGPHVLNLRVTDVTGNVAVFPDLPVTVSN